MTRPCMTRPRARQPRLARALTPLALALLAGCATAGATAEPATTASRPPATGPELTDSARPRPNPILETPQFRRAVERGTRTRDGRPGSRYWTQRARYALDARLDPGTRRLDGRGTIRYENHSPDTLREVAVHLRANLFAPDAVRNEPVPVTGGITLGRVTAGGQTLVRRSDRDGMGYELDGTVAWLVLPKALAPGDTTTLGFAWSYEIPPDGAPRGGTDGEVFIVSYWYPQVAVYDDVLGWVADQYMGRAEFYMGWADYDVTLTVPAGWLIASTGTLANAAEVLTPAVRARMEAASRADSVVHVVTDGDRAPGRSTLTGPASGARAGQLTWRFTARDVRDFAWGASDQWLWDATRAIAADSAHLGRGGDTVAIHTFYRPSRRAWAWGHSAEYAKHSVEFLSRYLWPYPYPQMTAADGVTSCSGMEYPMITCIGGERDTLRLYSVTVHEIAHMWFPMQVGSNEKRHAWQDEGLTRFNQAQAMREFFRGGYDLETIARNQYLDEVARPGIEVELMRHGDLYPTQLTYARASYPKMATNLVALRSILGDSLFLAAYREYGRRWNGRHPTPFDFFNTFEDVSGRNLDWFWRTWWYETWSLDHAVASVRPVAGGTAVVIEDRALAPMPARVLVHQADGRTQRFEIAVDAWLAGAREHTLVVPGAPVTRVELDPDHRFPDIDRTNDVWEAK